MAPDPVFPETPIDVFSLRPQEAAFYGLVIGFQRVTGGWLRGADAVGDVEKMTVMDKAYWLYKARHPVRLARAGSGLEVHFSKQKDHGWRLPAGFTPHDALTMSCTGDLMNHPYLPGSQGALYDSVADVVLGADLATANLECVVLPGASGSLRFTSNSGPPLFYGNGELDIVSRHGGRQFAFMSAACNHSLDFGVAGVDSTIRSLRERGIGFHGITAPKDEPSAATVIQRKGFRVGMVSFTFGLNGHHAPDDRPGIVNAANLNGGVAAFESRLLREQLERARSAQVDFLVAHLHWGLEHEFYPTLAQMELAHHIAELGVDAIIGHHPHVIQPMECYATKRDPDRIVPIYYSLGNLVNQFSATHLTRGHVAQLTLAKGVSPDGAVRTYVAHAGGQDVMQVVDHAQRRLALRPVQGELSRTPLEVAP